MNLKENSDLEDALATIQSDLTTAEVRLGEIVNAVFFKDSAEELNEINDLTDDVVLCLNVMYPAEKREKIVGARKVNLSVLLEEYEIRINNEEQLKDWLGEAGFVYIIPFKQPKLSVQPKKNKTNEYNKTKGNNKIKGNKTGNINTTTIDDEFMERELDSRVSSYHFIHKEVKTYHSNTKDRILIGMAFTGKDLSPKKEIDKKTYEK